MSTEATLIHHATDTFVIRAGKIRVQTFAMLPQPVTTG